MRLLFLWLLEDIAQSEVTFKKEPQCGLDVTLFQWLLGITVQSDAFFKKKTQCGLNVDCGYYG